MSRLLSFDGGRTKIARDDRAWKTVQQIRFRPLKNIDSGDQPRIWVQKCRPSPVLKMLYDQFTQIKFETISGN